MLLTELFIFIFIAVLNYLNLGIISTSFAHIVSLNFKRAASMQPCFYCEAISTIMTLSTANNLHLLYLSYLDQDQFGD